MGDRFASLSLNLLFNTACIFVDILEAFFWKSEKFPFASCCWFDSSQEFCNIKMHLLSIFEVCFILGEGIFLTRICFYQWGYSKVLYNRYSSTGLDSHNGVFYPSFLKENTSTPHFAVMQRLIELHGAWVYFQNF